MIQIKFPKTKQYIVQPLDKNGEEIGHSFPVQMLEEALETKMYTWREDHWECDGVRYKILNNEGVEINDNPTGR